MSCRVKPGIVDKWKRKAMRKVDEEGVSVERIVWHSVKKCSTL